MRASASYREARPSPRTPGCESFGAAIRGRPPPLDRERCHWDSHSRAGAIAAWHLPVSWQQANTPLAPYALSNRLITDPTDVTDGGDLAHAVPYTLATICCASRFRTMARYAGLNSRASSRARGSPKQKRPGALHCDQIERSKSI